jgi:hypothetical protein
LNTPSQKLLNEILDYAEAGEHLALSFIKSRPEYISLRKGRKVVKAIIRSLTTSANKLFRDYCKEVSAGKTQLNKLLMFNTLECAIIFYKQELQTLDDMLDEYEAYLMSGNFLDFIFNDQRSENKLWDHRGE